VGRRRVGGGRLHSAILPHRAWCKRSTSSRCGEIFLNAR
jgi:hypothetical protein